MGQAPSSTLRLQIIGSRRKLPQVALSLCEGVQHDYVETSHVQVTAPIRDPQGSDGDQKLSRGPRQVIHLELKTMGYLKGCAPCVHDHAAAPRTREK